MTYKNIVLYIVLTIFPAILFSYSGEQVMQDLRYYSRKIKSLNADVVIKTSGTGQVLNQKGFFSYSVNDGTLYRIDSPSRVVIIIRTNGDTLINGVKKPVSGEPVQMGDLYFATFLNRYRLKAESETDSHIVFSGIVKADKINEKKVLTIIYNKGLKAIDGIIYQGNETDYPYEIKITYLTLQGIPVIQKILTLISAFSVTVTSETYFENISLELNE